MKLVKIAAAVLNQVPLDWRHNLANVRAVLEDARAAGVSVVCLPELCLTGYGCEDAFHCADTHRRAWRALAALVPEIGGLVVSFGLPVLHQNAVFNVAALVVDGRLAGLVAKRFLAGDGIHYEPRWFKPWPAEVRDTFVAPEPCGGERQFPIGDLLFDVGGVRMGFEICEDAWVANRPGAALARRGVDLILNPSASHFAFGKLEARRRFVLEGSRAFGASYIYANLVGNEAGRAIFDGGALIASGGRLLAAGPRLGFLDRDLTLGVVDIEATRMNQARTGSYQPELPGAHALEVRTDFDWPELTPDQARIRNVPGSVQSRSAGPPASAAPVSPDSGDVSWESSATLKEEEFTRAVALALFDYLRKSRSQGFVVSLSGGADSSAVSCLVALSFELALGELGAEGVRAKLAHARDLPAEMTPRSLTGRFLTTAYQATENSGAVTRAAAAAVAKALGARHHELDVGPLHRGYVQLIEATLGRRLDWARDDIPLQNIQARVRSPGVWMLANLEGALLLSTSNRSEAAVGYATMDGDTSGGLSPIAGIDKAFLRHWLRWLETDGPRGLHSFPVLAAINAQQPTAELRPAEQAQTDETDLMPYPVLDAIEKAAIRDKRSPIEVFQFMRARFPDLEAASLAVWVERFFRLWSRNQWKRERYAPSFHLDDENLDPKTWCRWPILSGGFEVELAELTEFVKQQPHPFP
ncbi:MAG: NAD(+) synthase [Verrucomicrobia bacterium]|jgi:NAD+ synthase (glutamine-hydrolysing)|nr:NAD(+) synthase [Verrucomicrobiota bacterium]OQC63209.1 MAG: Glutamine-dependent NAD(+) synthetase [Verrucomicrobia bacterium ADurb.Bin006]MDI9379596.1 NAD(+) synthase [Verrucomicrobiota bacterium]NMD21651.1 NAD(+) synthase [Verrucomicrobiota bacterium]HOA60838.1 NAD(+) synthase [Verrucomicrobiota bacterium]